MRELFLRYPGFKTRAVTLSFDDGTVFDREMVKILNEYGMKCTFNLNSGSIGKENHISEKEAKALYAGHEVAIHTYNHPHLGNLDNASVLQEVLKDRENLERIFGGIIKGMAYPFCLDNDRVLEGVRMCGIDYARTVYPTYGFGLPDDFLRWNPTCHQIDERLDSLIDDFFVPDDIEHPWRITAKLFYLWGHSYEFENNFQKLEDICKKLGKKDNVWYATNGEVFRYVRNFRRLEFSADGTVVYNPTDTDIFVSCKNKNLLISTKEECIME